MKNLETVVGILIVLITWLVVAFIALAKLAFFGLALAALYYGVRYLSVLVG